MIFIYSSIHSSKFRKEIMKSIILLALVGIACAKSLTPEEISRDFEQFKVFVNKIESNNIPINQI